MKDTTQLLLDIAPYLSLISSSKGRVRVRISPKIISQKDRLFDGKDIDIDKEISKIDGIKNVKFNKLIGSVTVEYDNDKFPKGIWEDLVNGRNLDKIASIIDKLILEMDNV